MEIKLPNSFWDCQHYFKVNLKTIVPIVSFFLLMLSSTSVFAQGGGTCADIQPFCAGNDALIFANCNDQDPNCNATAEAGPDYGCLFSQPYPAWFYLQIDQPGNLDFEIIQNTAFNSNGDPIGQGLDVDFIAWGPFQPGDDLCDYTQLQSFNEIACSYSAQPIENFTIPNAQTGEIYVLVITNYNRNPGYIKLGQIGGDGSTNCDIVFDCSVTINEGDQNLCGEDEVLLTTTVSGPVETYEWYLNDVLIVGATSSEYLATETGEYKVIANGTECNAPVEDIVNVSFGPIVTAEAIDIIACDDSSNDGFEAFDLDGNSSRVLGNQDPDEFTVTYYLTQANADAGEAPLTSPYTNVTNPQIIYARVESNVSTVCYATSEVELKVEETVEITTGLPTSAEICDVEEFPVFDATPTNTDIDLSLVTYEWVDQDNNVLSTEAIFSPSAAGTYTVNIGYPCGDTSFTIVMNVIASPTVDLGADFQICANQTTILTANTDVEGVTFQWYLNSTLIEGETNNTLEVVIEQGTIGTQTYTVLVSNDQCTAEDSIDLTLYPITNCIISEGISPNGDGYNDILDLNFLNDRTGIRKIQIFNRFGTLVYVQDNYTNQWEGQTTDGDELPTGTYFYVIDLAGNDAVYGEQATGWIYLNKKAN